MLPIRRSALALVALSAAAFGQQPPDAFQIGSASNLNVTDSLLTLTNTANSGICVNAYVLVGPPYPELVACCATYLAPNTGNTVSAQQGLTNNTVNGVSPNGITIELVASAPRGGICNLYNEADPSIFNNLVSGMQASLQPPLRSFQLAQFDTQPGNLSNPNFLNPTTMSSSCASIIGNGAGYGICNLSGSITSLGRLQVTTNLPAATFSITGPATYTGSGTSFTQTSAPVGTYTTTYATIPGYVTPLSQSQTLAANGSLAFSGNYQVLPATPATAQYGQPSSSPRNASPSFAEPVNTATGNYYSTAADLSLPGRGLAFVFSRSYNSADTYSGPLGTGWTHSLNLLLVQNADNSVSIKEGDGGVIGFTLSGGNYTPATPGVFDSLAKNGDGSFTLTRKNQTRLTWVVPPGTTGLQRLTRIVDRNGNSQTLSYDSLGNLATATDTAGRPYSFTYDGNGHLIELTDPLGRALQYGYDASGRLTSFQDATGATTSYAYDASNRLVSATDPRGNVYLQNTYDSQGRVVAQKNARNFTTTFAYNTPATGTTTITDPLGKVTKHVLDGLGRLSQQIDALGGSTSYTYDNNNLQLSVTDPLGRVQSSAYDANGNPLSMTDPAGKTSSFTYDAKNNLLTSKDRLGRTSTFTYDSAGDLLTSTDPGGNTNTFTYDSFGEVLTARNGRGFATSFQYDSAGDLTRTTDALGGTITMAYDGVGRLTSVQNQLGKTATRTYDAANRLLSVTDPLNNSTQFQYDANGNLTKITDANGKQTQYACDATNKLAQVTDAVGGVTQYQYNGNTDLTGVTDAAGHATTYGYDSLRRVTVITDPLGRQRHYSYDAVGNVTSTVDGNAKTNSFGYDALNRLTSMSLSDGKNVAYTYDAVGNRLTMLDWHGATSYVYDVLNRATSVTTPDGKTVGYTYDAIGNRASLRYPDARTVQYTYDTLNRLTRVTDWASKSTNYSYDAASNLSGFTHPNGAASSYQYDFANRLTSIVNRSGSATLSSFTYALDKVGNRTQMTTSANGVNQFGYDGLYRLTSWTPPSGQSTQWMYDAVGNRKTMVSSAGTTNYSYDAADELLTAGATSFTYDGNGNQRSKAIGSTTVDYGWDALDRLTSAAGGATNTQYQYDGDGNRITQQTSAGTYAYVNDTTIALPIVLTENGPDGNIVYAYGASLVSATAPGFQYYYQFDGFRSAINLTDATGAQKANYTYDPWGKLTLPLDPLGSREKYKFAGEPLDPNVGFVFLRARYYDFSTGRFMSHDRRPGTIAFSGLQNRYQYAVANPLRFGDPSGLTAVDNSSSHSAFTLNTRNDGAPALALLLETPVTADSTPTSIGTGGIFEEFSIGPAFRNELKGMIEDKLLFGSLGSFLKDLGKGVFDAFSPSVSLQDTAKQFGNASLSGVSLLGDLVGSSIGTWIDVFKLLTVPEVAQ
jgi:RHS repeat-associated protein